MSITSTDNINEVNPWSIKVLLITFKSRTNIYQIDGSKDEQNIHQRIYIRPVNQNY